LDNHCQIHIERLTWLASPLDRKSAYQACRNFDLIQNVKDFLRSLEKGIHVLILA
jgi:hypothetical protein